MTYPTANDWKRLPGRRRYRFGAFSVWEDRWVLPNGTRLTFPAVRSPSFSVVVAVTSARGVPLIQNTHPSPGLGLVELPGGRIDPDETPRAAARRELEEETGWKARKLTHLGRYYPNPHWGTFEGHVFLGEGLSRGRSHLDPGESLRPVLWPIDEVYRRFHRGRFLAGSTIVGLSMAERYLQRMGLLSGETRVR